MNIENYNGIAIFGGMGSGKDTFAEVLAKNKKDSVIYNIGYICREFMKISKVNKDWHGKNRELSQAVASKLREIDENILNDYTYANAMLSNKFPIIVGGRTFEDFEYWTNKKFLVVGISANFDVRVQRLFSRDLEFNANDLNHKTEKDIVYIVDKLCPIVIHNNEDLIHLENETKAFLRTINQNKKS